MIAFVCWIAFVPQSEPAPYKWSDNMELQEISWPPFGLSRVKKLLDKAEDDGDVFVLSDKAYRSLSVDEKFTYCLINGEVDTQNCNPDRGPDIPNPDTKIFNGGSDSGPTDGQGWSPRQEEFLRTHRARSVALLRKMIAGKTEIAGNVYSAIELLDAYELTPDILAVYRRKPKNLWPLSLLLAIMRDGKYKPFLKSATYRKLYGPSSKTWSYIDGNPANVALIEKRAMAFYHSKTQ